MQTAIAQAAGKMECSSTECLHWLLTQHKNTPIRNFLQSRTTIFNASLDRLSLNILFCFLAVLNRILVSELFCAFYQTHFCYFLFKDEDVYTCRNVSGKGREYIFRLLLIFTKHDNGNMSKMIDKFTAFNLLSETNKKSKTTTYSQSTTCQCR